jgi:hypothetical protein
VRVTDRKTFDDRQLDAILERLDALRTELQTMNRRLDHNEGFLALAHEVRSLNESLQALAYAALGTQGPQVRRRRTGRGAACGAVLRTRGLCPCVRRK